jgi:hypothetical protein
LEPGAVVRNSSPIESWKGLRPERPHDFIGVNSLRNEKNAGSSGPSRKRIEQGEQSFIVASAHCAALLRTCNGG